MTLYYIDEFKNCFGDKITVKEFFKTHYFFETTMEMYQNKRVTFKTKDATLEDVEKMVQDGYSVFPFSSNITLDLFKKHLELGLKVVFMRMKDFRELKKMFLEN